MFVVGLFIIPSAEFIFFASDSLNCVASIVRAGYYTNQIQSDCFEYSLKFLLTSSYQKCLNIFLIFSKFSYPQKKPVMKNFKTKKKSLYHLPSKPPPPPPLRAGPRVKLYCLRCPFLLLVAVRHFSHFLCLSWFQSVWKYPHSAILLQYAVYSQYIAKYGSPTTVLTYAYSINIYRFLNRLVLLSLL